MPRPIAFLSDFGHRDPFVGICHGVIKRIGLDIEIIDIAHGIPRHDVRAGALALADAVRFMPEDTIFVAVVDPGVGSQRSALCVESTDGTIFIGPDNGVLGPAIELRQGAARTFDISLSPWRLEPLSGTFHGRDVFAPVAAQLALGAPLEEVGPLLGENDIVELEPPRMEWLGDAFVTTVLGVDEFGNVRLAGGIADVGSIFRGDRLEVTSDAGVFRASAASAYADGAEGSLVLIEDSTSSLALAVNQGHAAELLGITPGQRVRIRKA